MPGSRSRAWRTTGGRTAGSSSRVSRYHSVAPSARVAVRWVVARSCWRSAEVWVASGVHATAATASAGVHGPLPARPVTRRPARIGGTALMVSATGPDRRGSRPSSTPVTRAAALTARATPRVVSAPWATRASMSRPSASVPKGCDQEGARSRAAGSSASGSRGRPRPMTAASSAPYSRGRTRRADGAGGCRERRAPSRSAGPVSSRAVSRARAPVTTASRTRASVPVCRTGRSWARAARRVSRPRPGMSKICSTATAPPVRPTTNRPRLGSSAGTQRRSAWRATDEGGTPRAAAASAHGSANVPGSRSSSSRPSTAPAGRPRAIEGSTMLCGPYQPSAGSQPSCTPMTEARTEATRNSGSAASIADPVPPGRLAPSRRLEPSHRVRAHTAATVHTATATAPPISVRETPRACTAEGSTSPPETQDRPASPCSSRTSQRPSRDNGPSSRPSWSRTAASAPGVGSRSAERALSTVSAGSVRDSQGSRPIPQTKAAAGTARHSRVGPPERSDARFSAGFLFRRTAARPS